MSKKIASLAFTWLLLSLAAGGARAALDRTVGFAAGEGAGKSDAYRAAHQALEEERWAEAAAAFAAITETGGAEADAALYWRAYAEHRRGRSVEALEALRRLAVEFRDSAWRDDARALEVEIRGVSGEESEDDELKLYALNSLAHTNPERAIPILERFLAGDHSAELKERALFVLAQSGDPRASEILRDVAQGASDPDLRWKAVEYLGVFGGRETAELLAQIYATSSDPDLRSKILESFMVGGQVEQLLAVARQEADPDLKAKAIEMLAVSGASEELRGLFTAERDRDLKEKLLETTVVTGDTGLLEQVLASESDRDLRAKAIELLAVSGATEALRALYERERDPELREKMLESTVVSGDTELLRRVLASETDPQIQRKAVELMGIHGSREARVELVGLYRRGPEREIKEAVIEALMIAGDADALVEIVRSETDPELKREALEKLSMVDSDEAARFFAEILED